MAQAFVAQRVLDESRASLQVAEAQVALAQARLSRMRIRAPFDGTVGLRTVNLGDYVKDGADLVNLEDTSWLLVDFRLPERYQTRLPRDRRCFWNSMHCPASASVPGCRRWTRCSTRTGGPLRCAPCCRPHPVANCARACLPV